MDRKVIDVAVQALKTRRSEGSHDGRGVTRHLSDLQDKSRASASRALELADAVGGLVKLGWDVRDLGWRVLLVGRIPAFRLSRLVGLVRVMRMLQMRVTTVALMLAVLSMLLVLAV